VIMRFSLDDISIVAASLVALVGGVVAAFVMNDARWLLVSLAAPFFFYAR